MSKGCAGASPKGLVVFRWRPNVGWNQTERSSISDPKVVVVDVSSWIIEAFSSIASCSADAGVGAKRPGEAAGNWS